MSPIFEKQLQSLLPIARYTLSLVIIWGCGSFCTAQSSPNELAAEALFDNVVGLENTALFNGPQFKDLHFDAWDNSHIYLESANYVESELTYGGQHYSGVLLKYNVLDDELSIRSKEYLGVFKVKLIPNNVSSFYTHGRRFFRLVDVPLELEGYGFFELAAESKDVTLFIKHQKRKMRETVGGVPQYRLVSENYYLFKVLGTYHLVHTIRDLKEILPEKYLTVRSFYKEQKDMYRKDRDQFMVQLVNRIHTSKHTGYHD